MRSIRFRLTAWYAGILTATFALAGCGLLLTLRETIRETIDKDLRSRLVGVRQYLAAQHEGDAELPDDLEEKAAAGPGGAWLRIADRSGNWIYQSPATKGWDQAPLKTAGLPTRGTVADIAVGERQVRVLSAPVAIGVAQIGLATDEFDELLNDFVWILVLASPVLLVLASAGGYWMSGRALKPVDEISRTVKRIGARNLSARLRLRGTDDELDRLSETMNEMLSRLDAGFSRITQFTADASHELRTPVAIIRTTAEVIRARPRSLAEHEKAWGQVLAQTERTSRLIEDLLFLARADAGRDNLAMEPLDLTAALRSATDEMRILAEASGLRLSVHALPECTMAGDGDAIRRLLLILLDNAIKYTPAGGAINVAMVAEGMTAHITVRDTGIGIASEDLPHIFDRFYRTSRDRSRTTGGSGLGLSIAEWLASKHGGEICVESVTGRGSVFTVKFGLMGSSETIGMIAGKGV